MRVAVIGTGPTGIGAAVVLRRYGIEVDLVDGGGSHPDPAFVENLSAELRHPDALSKSHRRILERKIAERTGKKKRGATGIAGEIPMEYLQKPILGSDFVFNGVDDGVPVSGCWVPRSLAIGGLANVWGAACYPLRADDYRDWPLAPSDLEPWYGKAADLLHVHGSSDGLLGAYPAVGQLTIGEEEWKRDPNSSIELALERWRLNGEALGNLGLFGGRSRLAVRMTQDDHPNSCIGCGLCMTGCAVNAIWNGRREIEELRRDGVNHLPGAYVRRLIRENDNLFLECGMTKRRSRRLGPYGAVFLSAGPLSSFRIALQSEPGPAQKAEARLLDNDTYVFPFWLREWQQPTLQRFALSEAALAIEPGRGLDRAAHLQFYRPTGSMLGPARRLHNALRGPARAFVDRWISRIALGVVYFHGAGSRTLKVSVEEGNSPILRLRVTCETESQTPRQLKAIFQRLHHARDLLGMTPLAWASRRGAPAFSGHIGGTLPLRRNPDYLECSIDGRLRMRDDFPPVYVTDLSSFPEMPAQNPTLTGVANAMRIAEGFARKQGAGQ